MAASLLSVLALLSCLLMMQALYTASVSHLRSLRAATENFWASHSSKCSSANWLVPYVEPQGGMHRHIVLPKLRAVGHPHVNVLDEYVGQLARLTEAAPI